MLSFDKIDTDIDMDDRQSCFLGFKNLNNKYELLLYNVYVLIGFVWSSKLEFYSHLVTLHLSSNSIVEYLYILIIKAISVPANT